MANIELRLFRYFAMVAEERHFARAAERLGITPPTLTHQIQRLESWLGVRLCVRKPKTRVELTEAGKRFVEQARQVMRQAEEAERVARMAARGEIGRIEIGYMMSAGCAGLVQKCIGDFRRKHPAIEINLHRVETLVQLNGLAQNELDIGFARPPNQYPTGLRGFVVHRQPLVLALPSDHPLASSRRPIAPSELRGQRFISNLLEIDLGFPLYTEAVTALADFAPNVTKRVPDMFTVLTYVSAGFGIGVVSQSLTCLTLPNVVFRKLAVPHAPLSPIACVHRSNETAPAVQAFIRAMRRQRLDR